MSIMQSKVHLYGLDFVWGSFQRGVLPPTMQIHSYQVKMIDILYENVVFILH